MEDFKEALRIAGCLALLAICAAAVKWLLSDNDDEDLEETQPYPHRREEI